MAQCVANRLVMSEYAYFNSLSTKNALKELDVEEFEVVETLDNTTCATCGDMDGKHYPMDEYEIGLTAPPFHPNCRGTTCPYFDDEFDFGERAARDKDDKTYYVPGDMTYKEWKERFVDGQADNLQEIKFMKKFDKVSNITRTKEEFEQVANNIKVEITNYS